MTTTSESRPRISVLILTKNEAQDLPKCLDSVKWSDDIHLFDSFSTDQTVAIARSAGAKVTQRVFDNWSAHQNWGLANIKFKHPWVFYIDADERISEGLRAALARVNLDQSEHSAFEIRRRDFFTTGVWLKHAQISPFYVRLFRPEKMRYERLVNPISIVTGTTGNLEGYLDHYPFSKGVHYWIQRHIGYANMEARIRLKSSVEGRGYSFQKALFSNSFTERRLNQKGLFYMMPARPIIKWLYMVFWRRAFLDGRSGMTYASLQAIYEYFIVVKEQELRLGASNQTGAGPESFKA